MQCTSGRPALPEYAAFRRVGHSGRAAGRFGPPRQTPLAYLSFDGGPFEYSFRKSEIGRRETFGEPIVDRTDQITGFLELATPNPNAGKLQSRPQLEREPGLLLGQVHRLLQA